MMEPLNGILHFHGVSSFYKLILFAKIRRMGYQVHLCIIYLKNSNNNFLFVFIIYEEKYLEVISEQNIF